MSEESAKRLAALEQDRGLAVSVETLLDDLHIPEGSYHKDYIEVSWLDLHRVVTALTDLIPTLSQRPETPT